MVPLELGIFYDNDNDQLADANLIFLRHTRVIGDRLTKKKHKDFTLRNRKNIFIGGS